MMFSLMLVSSFNSFFHSEFQEITITTMKKDALYRLKNNEWVLWRTILYGIAKRCQKIVNPHKIVASHATFILDDTTDRRVFTQNNACGGASVGSNIRKSATPDPQIHPAQGMHRGQNDPSDCHVAVRNVMLGHGGNARPTGGDDR